MPNNRQWATLILFGVVALLALTQRGVRSGLPGILRTVAGPKLAIRLGLMAGWVGLEVWVGALLGLWNLSLTADTAFWFVFSGLVLFFNFEEAARPSAFFRTKAIAAFAPAVLMEGFLDEFALQLPVEIVLQSLLAFVAILAAVAALKEEHRPVASVLNVIVFLLVLGLIAASFFQLITGWSGIDKANLVRQIVLPGWLAIGLLPFIYFIALYAGYDSAFTRLRHSGGGAGCHWRAKIALVTSLHVKASEIGSFAGFWPRQLARASSISEARAVIQEFRDSKAEERRAEAEAKARLIRYAGAGGFDEDERRLDQREFDETTSALRWLATCMMGWYRNEGRYKADLLQLLKGDFTRQGLQKPSGITMRVDEAGQSWYAWRRTVTGWCFAMGAAAPPPDQWEYDGPEPPAGFPAEDPAWGPHAFNSEVNRNW